MPEQKSIEDILLANGHYPPEAFAFVQRGLAWTVEQLGRSEKPEGERHVSGQELSRGLCNFALHEWGLLARTVLESWNVRRTDDFGKIVFYLIENSLMQKQPEDSIEDFHAVYEFLPAMDRTYRIDLSNLGKQSDN
ncbi:MAG: hypothetical protein BIFFINMI_01323 [Phycisphaerae bacterium]|nr:hypothetical protein [Phycisphaerae bacterium]